MIGDGISATPAVFFLNRFRNPVSTLHPQIRPTALRHRGAFTLTELLVVMGIIVLLAGVTVTVFNSIGQARGVTEAAYQVASAIELARSEAVSRQTYVWLGFQPVTNPSTGNLDLRLGIVYSADGSVTNMNAGNMIPLGHALLLQRVGMAPLQGLPLGSNTLPAEAIDLSTFQAGTNFQIGMTNAAGVNGFSNGCTITFMPLGEVTTNAAPGLTSGFDPVLGLGLQPTRGTTNIQGNNNAAVLIDGSIGIPVILRP